MPLSEHEQRILDEIERRLAAEDPKFARTAQAATPRGIAVKQIKRGVGGFVSGLVFLIAGLFSGDFLLPLALAGFAVMLTAVLLTAKAVKELARVPAYRARSTAPGWFDRMEERWRKRFDRDDESP